MNTQTGHCNSPNRVARFKSILMFIIASMLSLSIAQAQPVGVVCLDDGLENTITFNDRFRLASFGTHIYVGVDGEGISIYDNADPANPVSIGIYEILHDISSVVINENSAYIGITDVGIEVLDLQNPNNPVSLAVIPIEGRLLAIHGAHAYIVEKSEIIIVDITKPAEAVEIGRLDTSKLNGFINGVAFSHDIFYLNSRRRMYMVDVQDPTNPFFVGEYYSDSAEGLQIIDDVAFIGAGGGGMHIVDVSEPALPELISKFETLHSANDIQLYNGIIYIADEDSGIHAVDVSNPAEPIRLGVFPIPSSISLLAFSEDGIAYSWGRGPSLHLTDIRNPQTPVMGSAESPGEAWGISVSGSIACIADDDSGLQVFDVSDPMAPMLVGSLDLPGRALDVCLVSSIAYVANSDYGLRVVDLSNPASPTLMGTFSTFEPVVSVQVIGNLAYIAVEDTGFFIISVEDPTNPRRFSFFNTGGSARDVFVQDNLAYVADGNEGMKIYDVINPFSPVKVGELDGFPFTRHVIVEGSVAYLSNGRIIDVSDPTDPFVIGTAGTSSLNVSSHILGQSVLFSGDSLDVVDVRDPTMPVIVGSYQFNARVLDQVAIGTLGYIANEIEGLQVINLSNNCTQCLADLNGDSTLNFIDVSIFIEFISTNDPAADLNYDGRWSFFDVSLFLQAFADGCSI